MKKIVTLFLVLLLVVGSIGLLASCKGKKDDQPDQTEGMYLDRVIVVVDSTCEEKFRLQQFTAEDFQSDNIAAIEYVKWYDSSDASLSVGHLRIMLKETGKMQIMRAREQFEKLEFVNRAFFEEDLSQKDFADNSIIFTLTREMSYSNYKYTVEDFTDIDVASVDEIGPELSEYVYKVLNGIPVEEEIKTVNIDKYQRQLHMQLIQHSKEHVLDVVEILKKRDDVASASPDYIWRPTSISQTASIADANPSYSMQWGIQNANVENAWNITQGGPEVLVGVIDTGIDGRHPDLQNQLYQRRTFLDPFLHCDFTIGNQPLTYDIPEAGNRHGTHVAGIIAAQNNDIGVVGVAPNI